MERDGIIRVPVDPYHVDGDRDTSLADALAQLNRADGRGQEPAHMARPPRRRPRGQPLGQEAFRQPMHPLRSGDDQAARPSLAIAARGRLNAHSSFVTGGIIMEARLVIASILIGILALLALASAIVLARGRRDHRRLS